MITQIISPVLVISILGLVFGLGLSYASKKFEVKTDEKVVAIREILPGANCGACGYSGCDAFAQAVADKETGVDGCPVGGNGVAAKIAEILGVEKKTMEESIAQVFCGGNYDNCKVKAIYQGVEDCGSATALYGGPSACLFGCMGLGTCVRACMFDAIVIENGLARVIDEKCTGCGACIKACPKGIISFVPKSDKRHGVLCSSHDRGNVTRGVCKVGCIGCTRCVKVCPVNAITMDNNLAVIDNHVCINCGACVDVCPTGSIKCL